MRSSITVALSCLLAVTAGPLAGQATDNNAVTGNWTGYFFRPSDGNRTPITMQLTLSRQDSVSGTITGPEVGQITTGSYEAASGGLRLEVVSPNEGGRRFLLEGTVVDGSAIGRVSSAGQRGAFKITRDAAGPGSQPAGGSLLAAALPAGFAEVTGWVTKAAEMVPAERYMYRPTASVRTFGELIGHIADAQNWYCARATGREAQWSDAVAKGPTDKATVTQQLKQSSEACNAVYGRGTPPLAANLAHTSLHYGNIITYMRMMGLVPPSS